MGWKRAVQPDQKAQRRAEILSAAGELLDEGGIEGAGLNAIARKVGCAKANLYRYFEGREAILIELLVDESREWFESVRSGLSELENGLEDMSPVGELLTQEMMGRPRFAVLLNSVSSVLEHNVEEETVIEMKRSMISDSGPMFGEFMRVIGTDDIERVSWGLRRWVTSACGLWSHAHPSEVVAKVMEREEFSSMCIEYESDCVRLAKVLFHVD